jgi:hypothetical protein
LAVLPFALFDDPGEMAVDGAGFIQHGDMKHRVIVLELQLNA